MGGNTAHDVISLIKAAMVKKRSFASGYIIPEHGEDTIGCLAMSQANLKNLLRKGEDAQNFILEMERSSDFEQTMFVEDIEVFSKKKVRRTKKRFRPLRWFRNLRRQHPMKFYGTLGILTLLMSLVTGFATVDYFYRHLYLNYAYAFTTVFLVIVSGFLMVAGMMLNALQLMVERLRSIRKWERSSDWKYH